MELVSLPKEIIFIMTVMKVHDIWNQAQKKINRKQDPIQKKTKQNEKMTKLRLSCMTHLCMTDEVYL